METKQHLESQEQDRQPSIQQNLNELIVYPLAQLAGGEWNLTDELIGSAFEKMQAQDLVDTTFWEGTTATKEQFIALMKAERNIVQFILHENKLLGVTWINGLSGNYAFAHFCLFRGRRTREIGRLVQQYWFGIHASLDILIGMIPDCNRLANNFVQQLGWTKLGTIPGMFKNTDGHREAAVIHYISRLEGGQTT